MPRARGLAPSFPFLPLGSTPSGRATRPPKRGASGASERPTAPLAPTPSAPVAFPTELKSQGRIAGALGSGALGDSPGVLRCTFPPTGCQVTVPEAPACQTGAHTDVKGKGDQTSAPSGAFDVTLCHELGSFSCLPLVTGLQLSINSYTPPCAKKHRELQGLNSTLEDLEERLFGVRV